MQFIRLKIRYEFKFWILSLKTRKHRSQYTLKGYWLLCFKARTSVKDAAMM